MKTVKHQALSQPAHSPSRGKVIVIVIFFVTISLLWAGIIYLQGNISDGVRTYVRGEGLWAKAQKDAVYYLTQYTYSHKETDYLAYLKALSANMGDKLARQALLQSPPNYDRARMGFLLGNNDPRDINSMIWFFLKFKNIKYMSEAIAIWEKADGKITELRKIGGDIRWEIKYSTVHRQKLINLRERLRHLDTQLLLLENHFSNVLGDGARWVKQTIWIFSIISLLIFVGIAVSISIQIIRSITKSENELIESETRFMSLKESNTIGIVSWNMDGSITNANAIFYKMLGYAENDILPAQMNWRELTPEEYHSRDQNALAELMQQGRCKPFEKAFYHKNGSNVPVLIGASLLSTHKDRGMAFVVDLTERKKSEEQLRLAATVISSSRDGIIITDSDAKIISVNDSFCEMSGYTTQELLGTTPGYLHPGQIPSEQLQDMKAALVNKNHWQGNILGRHKNGKTLPIRISISAVRDNHGKLTHYVTILSDNSQQKAQEDHLRHVALHDPLTDLPNRALFQDRIAQAIANANRSQTLFAVLYLDLNYFKKINDRYGHTLGDKLLQTIACRLVQNTRATDTVSRLGGDEFAILLDKIDDRKTAENILNQIINSTCIACDIDGNVIHPSVSVGMAIYPDDGVDENLLMHHADLAMYEMKNGTNRDTAYGHKL